MKVKLVFFDCDGVLIFGNPWLWLHKEMNVSPKQDREWFEEYFAGKSTYKQWNQKIEKHYIKQRLHRKTFENVINLQNFTINEEANKLIKYIKNRNIPIAIISSGIDYYVSRVAQYFEIEDWYANAFFDFNSSNYLTKIRYVDKDPEAKVLAINEICEKFNILPQESIFIGDSGNDIKAFEYTKRGILYKTKHPKNKEYTWAAYDTELLKASWKKVEDLNQIISIIESVNKK